MLHAPLCHGLDFFLVFVYLVVTVFSSQVLDTNTSSCVVSSALYTLTATAIDGLRAQFAEHERVMSERFQRLEGLLGRLLAMGGNGSN